MTGYEGEETVPHHAIGNAWLTGKGMAKKGSDLTCIPIRQCLHNDLHDMGWKTFENLHNFSQIDAMVKTILQAESDGVLEVNLKEVKNHVR
ncbi:MAG: hypothetical protein KAT90_10370 [Gammaproteobacteria bacterium]|nr:hypothetical protein [Gammaproteobacteria bacterium]